MLHSVYDDPSAGLTTTTQPMLDRVGVEKVHADDWEKMVESMEDVVHRGNKGFRGNGTAWAYIGRDIDYRMAGKSGTAQVVEISQGEVYDEQALSEFDRKHAWFIAFAPVENPTIALAVLVENGGGGSSVAAPVARAVIDAHMEQQRHSASAKKARASWTWQFCDERRCVIPTFNAACPRMIYQPLGVRAGMTACM